MKLLCAIPFLLCATLPMALTQLSSLYVTADVTAVPPLFLEEEMTVQVRAQCSLQCQRKEWCDYFQVCSGTGFLCKLYRKGVKSSPVPLPTGCKMFKQITEEPCVGLCTSITKSSSETGDDENESPEAPDVDTDDLVTAGRRIGEDKTSFCSDWSQPPCYSYFTSKRRKIQTPYTLNIECPVTSFLSSGIVVLTIEPSLHSSPLKIPCYKTRIIIQRRSSYCPHGFFNKTWTEFEEGFGDLTSDCFWLGLSKIRKITRFDTHSLIIKVWNDRFPTYLVTTSYTKMEVEWNENHYRLTYESYSGPDGFSRHKTLNGREFFTIDRDQSNTCAQDTGSGWWFNDECDIGNLNNLNGPLWRDWDWDWRFYDSSEMSLDRNLIQY